MVNSKFKAQVHAQVVKLIEEQHQAITHSINHQNEGAQGSSSAGDKHNTEGAMQHLELEKKHIQLASIIQNQQTLQKFNLKKGFTSVNSGALIITNKGLFYLAVAAGKMTVAKKEIMVISLASPIGQILRGMKKGDSTSFNEQPWTILDIF